MTPGLIELLRNVPLGYIGCIVVGIPLGYALRKRPGVVRIVDNAASGLIFALLFLLGASLGANEDLLPRIGELGLLGLTIGLFCMGGSLLAVYFLAGALRFPNGKL